MALAHARTMWLQPYTGGSCNRPRPSTPSSISSISRPQNMPGIESCLAVETSGGCPDRSMGDAASNSAFSTSWNDTPLLKCGRQTRVGPANVARRNSWCGTPGGVPHHAGTTGQHSQAGPSASGRTAPTRCTLAGRGKRAGTGGVAPADAFAGSSTAGHDSLAGLFVPVIEEVLEGTVGQDYLQLSPVSTRTSFSQHGQDASRPLTHHAWVPRDQRTTPSAWDDIVSRFQVSPLHACGVDDAAVPSFSCCSKSCSW